MIELLNILHTVKPYTSNEKCFFVTHGYGALVLRVTMFDIDRTMLYLLLWWFARRMLVFSIGGISLHWLESCVDQNSDDCTAKQRVLTRVIQYIYIWWFYWHFIRCAYYSTYSTFHHIWPWTALQQKNKNHQAIQEILSFSGANLDQRLGKLPRLCQPLILAGSLCLNPLYQGPFPSDGVVSVEETHLPGEYRHVVVWIRIIICLGLCPRYMDTLYEKNSFKKVAFFHESYSLSLFLLKIWIRLYHHHHHSIYFLKSSHGMIYLRIIYDNLRPHFICRYLRLPTQCWYSIHNRSNSLAVSYEHSRAWKHMGRLATRRAFRCLVFCIVYKNKAWKDPSLFAMTGKFTYGDGYRDGKRQRCELEIVDCCCCPVTFSFWGGFYVPSTWLETWWKSTRMSSIWTRISPRH